MKSKIDTLFLDIDGCLFEEDNKDPTHFRELLAGRKAPVVLPGVLDFLEKWVHEGNKLIFTTGRAEPFRAITMRQLDALSLPYDQLIMNVGTGVRILVNNNSKDGSVKAKAIAIETNGDFTKELE